MADASYPAVSGMPNLFRQLIIVPNFSLVQAAKGVKDESSGNRQTKQDLLSRASSGGKGEQVQITINKR
jgi:hypothetical protein